MSEKPKIHYPRGIPTPQWSPEEEGRLGKLTERTNVKTTAQILGRSEPAVRVRASRCHFSWRSSSDVHPLNQAAKLCNVAPRTFLRIAKRAGVQIPPPNTSGMRPITHANVNIIRKRIADERAGRVQKHEPYPSLIPLNTPKGKEWFRQRTVYARAFVFLEKILATSTGVSLEIVMSKLGFSPISQEHPDIHLIFEAAEAVGIIEERKNNTILFKKSL